MDYLNKFKGLISTRTLPFFVTLSFLIWMFAFRGFLSSSLALESDAQAYAEHFYYWIENMARGVFPIWEPDRNAGIPVEFFLRRIGAYNPLYFGLLILRKFHMPFIYAYLIFLTSYFFLGMIGFLQTLRKVIKDDFASYVAFLLLLFSSLSTRVFDSYIIFICVPMVWFFYYLLSFKEKPSRYAFLGIILTLMILLITYIPLYFMMIVFVFTIAYILFYFRDLPQLGKQCLSFVKKYRLFVLCSMLALVVALIPGYQFYKIMSSGDLVLPERNEQVKVENEMVVSEETSTTWGIAEYM